MGELDRASLLRRWDTLASRADDHAKVLHEQGKHITTLIGNEKVVKKAVDGLADEISLANTRYNDMSAEVVRLSAWARLPWYRRLFVKV